MLRIFQQFSLTFFEPFVPLLRKQDFLEYFVVTLKILQISH